MTMAVKFREAAKKFLILVAGPLRGGGGLKGCGTKELFVFFCKCKNKIPKAIVYYLTSLPPSQSWYRSESDRSQFSETIILLEDFTINVFCIGIDLFHTF